jgi:type I restriction enzyme S subunit
MRLRYDDINRMYSIVPPLDTQPAIVTYLDRKTQQIQEFIAKKERLIELLEEQKRGVINKAITKGISDNPKLIDTNIEWLGSVPFDWSLKKLKYITTLISDGTHVTPTYVEKGLPFLRITDIEGDHINWDEVRYVSEKEHNLLTKTRKGQKGDILLSKNGTIGKVIEVTWDDEFSFFVSLCLIRFKKSILPQYFSYFFKSDIVFDQLNEGSKSTSVTNLHLEKIKELRIVYPDIDEQIKVCSFLDVECGVIDKVITKAKSEIEKAKEYQESLITQIVTGQLKVPEKASANFGKNIALGMVAEQNGVYHSKH